jgi:hypothetical protein
MPKMKTHRGAAKRFKRTGGGKSSVFVRLAATSCRRRAPHAREGCANLLRSALLTVSGYNNCCLIKNLKYQVTWKGGLGDASYKKRSYRP